MAENAQLALADNGVWRSASALVATHGDRAALYALQCIDLANEVGNFGRAARWRLVWQATCELTATEGDRCLARH